MSNRSLAIALSTALLLGLPSSSPAQISLQGGSSSGYWSQGKWIGYTPAHMKHPRAGAMSQPSSAAKPAMGVMSTVQKQTSQTAQSKPVATAAKPTTAKQAQTVSYEEAAPVMEGEMVPDGTMQESGPIFGDYVEGPTFGGPTCGGPTCDGPACSMGGPCSQYVCGTYCPTWRLYGRVEYLGWWTKGMDVPPLVTTSPSGTAQEAAGVLGQAGTRILFGNEGLTSDGRSGGRFTLGVALDSCEASGLEVTYMTLGTETDSFAASQINYPILARPFFNVADGIQDSRLIAYPDLLDGSLAATASTQVQGIELLFRRPATRSCFTKVDYMIGYRWLQVDDDVRISESTLVLTDPSEGTTIDLTDNFHATNNFHGVELGIDATRQLFPLWSIQFIGKVGLGNSHSEVNINGLTTTTTAAGDVSSHAGGLLTQPTNIGNYERDTFATTTELGVILHRQLSCNLHATFGYTFLYWSNLARAGDQIDFDVNLTQVPPGPLEGAPRPEFSFNTTDFWAQGMHFGLEYTF